MQLTERVFVQSARSEVSQGEEDFSLIHTSSVSLFRPFNNPSNLCCHHWPALPTWPPRCKQLHSYNNKHFITIALKHLHVANPTYTNTCTHNGQWWSKRELNRSLCKQKWVTNQCFFMLSRVQGFVKLTHTPLKLLPANMHFLFFLASFCSMEFDSRLKHLNLPPKRRQYFKKIYFFSQTWL